MKKFKYKLLLMFSIMFLILVGVIGAYNIITTINSNDVRVQHFEENLLENYDQQIKNQVESAYSLLDYSYEQYQSGELTEEEAKTLGSNLVSSLRYGETGYFWIDNTDGILIAHPMASDTVGNNRLNIQDPDGTYLMKNIISAATEEGNDGFSEYVWEKPGVDHLVVKRAYSVLFEPWNFIISTGNYIDDIDLLVAETAEEYKQEMLRNVRNQVVIIVILLLISGFIAYTFSNRVSKNITKITEHVKRVANNDLSAQELTVPTKDEIGQLAININQMVSNLKTIIKDIVTSSDKVTNYSEILFQSSSEVKEGSFQISATIQELASGSETQANTASDLSYSMSEFATKITEANADSGQVSTSSSDVLQLTNEGNQLMISSIEQMSAIDTIVQDAVRKVQGLDQQSQEISKLIAVIKAIAEQTNLLALNAAIEAARAGEHGKGFAVVAEEVRKLAEQVSSSVTDIVGIVNGIQVESSEVVSSLQNGYKEVEKGTEQIKSTGVTFNKINTSLSDMISKIQTVTNNLSDINENSSQMNQLIEDIAAVSQESAAGIEQTSASIQQTNSSMEDIAGSAEQLSKLADNLNGMVRKFKV